GGRPAGGRRSGDGGGQRPPRLRAADGAARRHAGADRDPRRGAPERRPGAGRRGRPGRAGELRLRRRRRQPRPSPPRRRRLDRPAGDRVPLRPGAWRAGDRDRAAGSARRRPGDPRPRRPAMKSPFSLTHHPADPARRRGWNPARLAERHGRAVILITIFLAVAGGISFFYLPSSIYPPLEVPRLLVIAKSGTLPARSMMLTVTRPLEQAAMEVPGIRRVRSRTFRGSTEISAQFDPGTDMPGALQLLQGRVDEV